MILGFEIIGLRMPREADTCRPRANEGERGMNNIASGLDYSTSGAGQVDIDTGDLSSCNGARLCGKGEGNMPRFLSNPVD